VAPAEAATTEFRELLDFVYFPGTLKNKQLEKELETPLPTKPKSSKKVAPLTTPPAPLRAAKSSPSVAKATPKSKASSKSKKGSGEKRSNRKKAKPKTTPQPSQSSSNKAKAAAAKGEGNSSPASEAGSYYHFASEGVRGEMVENTPPTGPLSDLIPSPGGFQGSDAEGEEETRLTRSALRNNTALSLCTEPLPDTCPVRNRSPAKTRSPAKVRQSASPPVHKTVTPPRLKLNRKQDESPQSEIEETMLSPVLGNIFNEAFMQKVKTLNDVKNETEKLVLLQECSLRICGMLTFNLLLNPTG